MPALNWDTFTNLPGAPRRTSSCSAGASCATTSAATGSFVPSRTSRESSSISSSTSVAMRLAMQAVGGAGSASGTTSQPTVRWERQGEEIEDGIRKTEAHVPGLTDWVLWTHRTLTKSDQHWFSGLSSRMTLHLWAGDEVDNLLTGQASRSP